MILENIEFIIFLVRFLDALDDSPALRFLEVLNDSRNLWISAFVVTELGVSSYSFIVVRKRTRTVQRYGPYTCCTVRTPYYYSKKVRTHTITRTSGHFQGQVPTNKNRKIWCLFILQPQQKQIPRRKIMNREFTC